MTNLDLPTIDPTPDFSSVAPPPPSSRIRDLPEAQRPRERLLSHGPAALRDDELIALFLGTGSIGRNAVELAEDLLRHCNGLVGLARADIKQLTGVKGIGPAKAIHLHAALELGRRLARQRHQQQPLDGPEKIHDLLAPEMQHLPVEVLKVVLVDTRYHLIRIEEISRGSLNESIAHPREILHPCLLHRAHSFFLVHNHPSGDPSPSSADRALTRKIQQAAALIEIPLLDHLIIGSPDAQNRHPGYYSFQAAGLL